MKYATFQTLTVRQYQELYRIRTSKDYDDVEQRIQLMSVLTGLSENKVQDLKIPEFNKISREIASIFNKPMFKSDFGVRPKAYIKIGGKKFGIIYNPATISAGQEVSINTWMSTGIVENLNKIMASLVYPVKGVWPIMWRGKDVDHVKVSEQILDCKFIEVHSTCVFFLKLWRNSIKALVPYLEKEMKKGGQTKEKIQELRTILNSAGDGFLMPSELQTLKT